ncbi:hypothetical protein PENVUL_c050G08114 [Penicillium vulpinum]|uniref:Uncharacterized protein n=1 Tax=Penicillium vulpinum TaxID=29845 RepID=A0A1V6RFC9_9EURO|nr:hypothetical protein PENVUL_c050G08114 [Penicillium vulpinum]
MNQVLLIVQRTLASLQYHPYTLWLLVLSDFKTIVVPSTIFGITNAWAASKYDPHVPAILLPPQALIDSPKSVGRALAAFLWVLINLVPFAINNQRGERAIAEDCLNKPWRPFPRSQISHEWGTRLMIILYVFAPIYSLAFAGGVRHSVALIWLGVWYNNWGGADKNPVIRNFINGLGYTCFASGAMEVALGGSFLPLHPLGWSGRWLIVIIGVIFSTVQLQDMSDQPGDAKRGRRTVPLVWGDTMARWTIALPMLCRPEVCEVWEVKLLSHASVLAFGECISKLPNLDAAILNAAIATSEFGTAE